MYNFQIIANDFHGFNDLFFRKLFNFFLVFLHLYSVPMDKSKQGRSYWFQVDILINLLRTVSLKANDF